MQLRIPISFGVGACRSLARMPILSEPESLRGPLSGLYYHEGVKECVAQTGIDKRSFSCDPASYFLVLQPVKNRPPPETTASRNPDPLAVKVLVHDTS